MMVNIKQQKSFSPLYVASIVLAYLTLNISLNALNKWMLSSYNFRFPLLLSATHAGFNFLALLPVMMRRTRPEDIAETLNRQFAGLCAVGLFFSMGLGLNNISLMTVPLSVNQMIRAALPVFTAIFAIFIEGKSPSRLEFVSLVILCGGVAVAVAESSQRHVSTFGVISCFLGSVCSGLMVATSGRLLTEKLDGLALTFFTAPVVFISLIPFVWQLELVEFLEYQATHTSAYLGYLLWGCMNACAYNIVHYLVIHTTSSVTTTVLGEVKIVMLLMFSYVFLGEEGIWSVKMIMGCGVSLIGFGLYSHCKLKASTLPGIAPGMASSGSSALLTGVGLTQLQLAASTANKREGMFLRRGADVESMGLTVDSPVAASPRKHLAPLASIGTGQGQQALSVEAVAVTGAVTGTITTALVRAVTPNKKQFADMLLESPMSTDMDSQNHFRSGADWTIANAKAEHEL